MEKKSSETLQHKRSFFVRMVSDPKLYNPKIVKMDRRHKLQNMGITTDCSDLSYLITTEWYFSYHPTMPEWGI